VTGSTRNLGLDALRGLAVVLMVQQHMGVWLTRLRGPGGFAGPILLHANLAGGAAAPLFITLAGVGVAFSEATPRPPASASWFKRGVYLLLVAYGLNLVTPRWFTAASFYVLHLIACFWLLVPVLRRLPTAALGAFALCVLGLGEAGQEYLSTPALLGNPRMGDASLPGGALRLALLEGHFPLFPWLAFALGGLCGGRLWLEDKRGAFVAAAAGALAGGSLLLLAARPLRLAGIRAGRFSFYPATPAFVLLLLGVSLSLVALALWAADRDSFPRATRWAALGRLSLTTLVVHVVLFRTIAPVFGLSNTLTPLASLAVIGFFLAALAGLAGFWQRTNYRLSLEWVLSRLSRDRAGPGTNDATPPPPSNSALPGPPEGCR